MTIISRDVKKEAIASSKDLALENPKSEMYTTSVFSRLNPHQSTSAYYQHSPAEGVTNHHLDPQYPPL